LGNKTGVKMTILNYEHHVYCDNAADALSRFIVFAGSCGWTIQEHRTNIRWGGSDWIRGYDTYGLIHTTGNGDQQFAFTFYAGRSGDVISYVGKTNDHWDGTNYNLVGVDGDKSPVYVDLWPNELVYPVEFFKTSLIGYSPNIWFFGNERMLAFHCDNDGKTNSQFAIGTVNTMGTGKVPGDGGVFQLNCHGENGPNYLDHPNTEHYNHIGVNSGRFDNHGRPHPAFYINGKTQVTDVPGVSGNSHPMRFNFHSKRGKDNDAFNKKIWDGNWLMFWPTTPGYKMDYSNQVPLIKQRLFWYHETSKTWKPLGVPDWYIGYTRNLKDGEIFELGGKRFMAFGGFNKRNFGNVYQIPAT